MMPEIPFDLVIEILTRLPAKSLMRFKSVSKPWSTLVCSRSFTNRNLKFSSSSPRLYMRLGLDNRDVLLSTSSSPDPDVSSFVIDKELTIPPMKGYYISHVFRGLMCFVKESSAKIYNTTTRQLVVLPDIEKSNIIAYDHNHKRTVYYIGHDPVHDQYKVVCTVSRPTDEDGDYTYLSEHWVLLLGGDESSRWRMLPSRCPQHRHVNQVLNINGQMHYLAWVRLFHSVLVSFDINSEEISMLHVPKADLWPKMVALIEYGGRVALLDHCQLRWEGVMELYVVEDAKKISWSSKSLVLHPSQMHLVNSVDLKVEGTTRNGDVVLVPHNTTYTRTGNFIKPHNSFLRFTLQHTKESYEKSRNHRNIKPISYQRLGRCCIG